MSCESPTIRRVIQLPVPHFARGEHGRVSPDGATGLDATEHRTIDLENADREKRFVALSSVVAAVFLTGMKIVVGLMTGSLGILSEAAHSALDLVAAAVTLWAVRISGKPADPEHTYGHAKFENLSALVETLLLLVTCIWIVYEAVERLFFRPVGVEASVWGFVVMGVSIVIDLSRSRALALVAKKYGSQALEADALHFSSDIWSSSVVIVGLGFVSLSERLGVPWLVKADSVAALCVAVIVVWVSVQLGRKTLSNLLDTVPADLMRRARERVLAVPGVLAAPRIRMRRTGGEWFSDIVIQVDASLSMEASHRVTEGVEKSLADLMPGGDPREYPLLPG
jgi:cation diffusion facilitator family transporter